MTRLLNRRTFLRGLGGACVAAPFLSSVSARTVRAQSSARAKRLIVMFTHHGCITTRFFPKKSHGALTAADLEPTTLKHLMPYVDKLLMPRGIRAMNEWTADLSRGQGNDVHTQVVGSYFTCQPVTPNSDEPFSFREATKFRAMPVGPSLDHVIARQLSPKGAPLLLNVAHSKDGPQSAISYSAAETLHEGLGNPQEVYAELTGLFRPGAPLSPDGYRVLRGKSILDVIRDDLDTLQRFDMSRSDRTKLDAWKSLLRDTETGVNAAACSAEQASRLGLTEQIFSAEREMGTDVLTGKISATMDGADLFSSLAVLAAVCNANPVIFLKYPSFHTFSGLGIHIDYDSLSHRLDNASMRGPCVTNVIDLLLKIDDFHARKFAYLVEQLNRFDEGNGTLLDNSAVVWFQENSDGCACNLNNLPIVQVGSAGGYFKTGWAVNVDDGAPDLSTGNSEAFCTEGTPSQVDGLSQLTGTDPKLANAPINKYYCSLMNALGVKAGEDGFPAVGGAQEVTRYGMYDKTEDFIGGGTNPPKIHSPGEFTALRAMG